MKHTRPRRTMRLVAVAAAASLVIAACGGDDDDDDSDATAEADAPADEPATDEPADDSDSVGVSLILKNTSNPFFVSMADSAQAEADALGVNLTVAAGQEAGDTQSQIEAIEAAIARGDAAS